MATRGAKPKVPVTRRNGVLVKDAAVLAKTDVRLFFRITEWNMLWDDWNLSVTSEGRRKWNALSTFIEHHAKSKEQRMFLRWYLGPVIEYQKEERDPAAKYPWCKMQPQDWVKRRDEGSWFGKANLEKFTIEIKRRLNALDAIRETGNKFTLTSLVRCEQLAASIDEMFQGSVYSPSLSFKENMSRAEAYIGLQSRIQSLKASAFDLYAKAHGVNFSDMQGYLQIMSASLTASVNDKNNPAEKAISDIARMSLLKAAAYKLPLPKDMQDVVVDVTKEPDSKEEKPN